MLQEEPLGIPIVIGLLTKSGLSCAMNPLVQLWSLSIKACILAIVVPTVVHAAKTFAVKPVYPAVGKVLTVK